VPETLVQPLAELAEAYQTLAEMEFARSEFLTTIAHELRTPLTAAGGFLQMIQKGMLRGNILNSAMDQVTCNIQDIIALVNDILFIQEMDLILPDFVGMDLNNLIQNLVKDMQILAESNGVELQLNLAEDMPKIMGDEKSLFRAFKAVIDNAVKFSPNGGLVEIMVGWNQDNTWVKIQDQGVGIPEEAIGRIFDRFFHLDEIGGHLFRGVGLGLSIAQQVVEQHKGWIEAESEPGKGSLFTIYLPYQKN